MKRNTRRDRMEKTHTAEALGGMWVILLHRSKGSALTGLPERGSNHQERLGTPGSQTMIGENRSRSRKSPS